MKQKVAQLINRMLKHLGAEIVRWQPSHYWDKTFKESIERAKRENRDPNEVLEEKWSNTVPYLEKYIYPYFKKHSVVCEIGAGTGRFSRQIIGRCRKLYLVDNSPFVCNFLKNYYRGWKDTVEVILCNECQLPQIPSHSVNLVFSVGTFVHLDLEQFYGYFLEVARILHKGGVASIHYANIMNPRGIDFFKKTLPTTFKKSMFRFHHSETIHKLAEDAGLKVLGEVTIEIKSPNTDKLAIDKYQLDIINLCRC